ncbi:hypothetical protein [Mitsuokella jalaludinii]|uniref:hypothetical protein n=1 Tax=Mitsuokella jalaludinii TaxID=187979 RepID=UPI003F9A4E88
MCQFEDDAALSFTSRIDGQVVPPQTAFPVRLDFVLWAEQGGHARQQAVIK